jgi:hypothetical protein
MNPSLHTPEVYHAVSIRFRDLSPDLPLGCASEPEEMYDETNFSIHKDVYIK